MTLSARSGLGALLIAVACAFGITTSAAPAAAVSGWSCSLPPAGHTFIAIRQSSGVCGSPYPVIRYNVQPASDGLLACTGVTGWAITGAQSSYNICAINQTAFQVRLAAPRAGLWSCNVPAGWTYSQQRLFTNTCGIGTFAMFQLAPLA